MFSILKKRNTLMVLLLVLLLMLTLGRGLAGKGNDSKIYENLKVFTEVLSIVESNYVDEVNSRELIYGAVKGALKTLDPHSSFLEPEMFREMQVETTGTFGGLGIEITIKDDQLTVVSPIEGTPAHRAGIQAGDRIVRIEGVTTKDMNLMDAVKRMRGPKGTKVTITIMREGLKEPKDITIIREIITVHSVKYSEVDKGIGYIKIRQFQEKTGADLENALEKLEKQEIQGLILDLRNNPGGLLSSAVEISEKFLGEGKLIVYTEGRLKSQNMRFTASKKMGHVQYPLVVLVNHGSASASEIVAGSIQDWGRGLILGNQTFGKGSVQTIIPLSDGSGLRLTTARYFTPKGKSIHGKGITPDIIVEQPKTKEEEAMLKALKEEGLKDPSKKEEPPVEQKKKEPLSEAEELKQDIQLQRAIEILKATRIFEKTRPLPKAS